MPQISNFLIIKLKPIWNFVMFNVNAPDNYSTGKYLIP